MGSNVGKKSLAKTSADAVAYRKKSYHSMAVPITDETRTRLILAASGKLADAFTFDSSRIRTKIGSCRNARRVCPSLAARDYQWHSIGNWSSASTPVALSRTMRSVRKPPTLGTVIVDFSVKTIFGWRI